ncbi:hypothetical protein LYNGBM3L_12480 [Moorena producens 3L]|uniref:Uncharacterized protein n=1 Tax=Moorena producens 3L TaxID=489825 RepID=F4XKW6_9CYAN|nr:hypothetical protein LYNGBM3L_12480 [Moorena producens 3L]
MSPLGNSKFKIQNSRIKFRTNFELINSGYKPPGELKIQNSKFKI